MRITKNAIKRIQRENREESNQSSIVDALKLYNDYPVQQAFQDSKALIRVLLGPLGSAKTTTCCMEIMRIILKQKRNSKGWIASKGAFIRHTLKSLNETAVFEWKKLYGKVSVHKQHQGKIIVDIPDIKVYSEISLICLDKPTDTDNLMSLPLTFAWINEGRTIKSFDLLGDLIGRLNRYPADNQKGYLLIDSNLCGHSHWLYKDIYEKQDEDKEVFIQPSGLSDEAENRSWLAKNNRGDHKNYYNNLIPTMAKQKIETDVYAKWSYYFEGKEVYPEFDSDSHVIEPPPNGLTAKDNINWVNLNNIPEMIKFYGMSNGVLFVGIDPGVTNSAYVICFKDKTYNRWTVLKERCFKDTCAKGLAHTLMKDIKDMQLDERLPAEREVYYGRLTNKRKSTLLYVDAFIDPAGTARSSVDKDATFISTIKTEIGLDVNPAIAGRQPNNVQSRRQALHTVLKENRIVFHSTCRQLIEGMSGGFCYKRVNVSGEEKYSDTPDKNKYSHVCEALEYALIGGGEVKHSVYGEDKHRWYK